MTEGTENTGASAPVGALVMPSLNGCADCGACKGERCICEMSTAVKAQTEEVRHLRTRYEQAMRYGIDLQRAIEYHYRGEIVPDSVAEGCPYHAQKLNARLKTLLQMLGSA